MNLIYCFLHLNIVGEANMTLNVPLLPKSAAHESDLCVVSNQISEINFVGNFVILQRLCFGEFISW